MMRFEVADDCRCAADVRAKNRHVMMLRKRSYARPVVPKLEPPPEPEPVIEMTPPPPSPVVEADVEIPQFQPLPASVIRLIISSTATHFRITTDELLSERRFSHLVKARWVAIYLIRKLTTRSLLEIGRRFGFDHSTIHHAVSGMAARLAANDPVMVTACREIEEKVTSRIRK